MVLNLNEAVHDPTDSVSKGLNIQTDEDSVSKHLNIYELNLHQCISLNIHTDEDSVSKGLNTLMKV